MLAGCLGIIGDMCDIFGVHMKNLISQPACNYMITKMKNSGNRKYDKICDWASYVNTLLYLFIH
jgi:hypothetical protein